MLILEDALTYWNTLLLGSLALSTWVFCISSFICYSLEFYVLEKLYSRTRSAAVLSTRIFNTSVLCNFSSTLCCVQLPCTWIFCTLSSRTRVLCTCTCTWYYVQLLVLQDMHSRDQVLCYWVLEYSLLVVLFVILYFVLTHFVVVVVLIGTLWRRALTYTSTLLLSFPVFSICNFVWYSVLLYLSTCTREICTMSSRTLYS